VLNRAKVLCELEHISSDIFRDISDEFNGAMAMWRAIERNAVLATAVRMADFRVPLPVWNGAIGQRYSVDAHRDSYKTLCAIDGSQVYPDRHQGVACFLINIGTVVISYGIEGRKVLLESNPVVCDGNDELSARCSIVDVVNCRRQEYEFLAGVSMMARLKRDCIPGEQILLLFDGSLIFWHLDSKDTALRLEFLSRYCASLDALRNLQVAYAGYISVPHNKDLVNVLRFAAQEGIGKEHAHVSLDHILDVHICDFFLEPSTRSTVFKHTSQLSLSYPEPLQPHFFYLHVGSEIARVEIPAWIAQQEELVDILAGMVLDNALKGRGYPVVLAESHEQAVVKGPDREFFYHLIQKIGLDKHHHVALSQKSIKKRVMSI
jgi:hypothetical protein